MKVDWTISESSGEIKREKKEKLPFVPKLDISDKMKDSQKTFAEQYNLMRKTLMDNGLMNKR